MKNLNIICLIVLCALFSCSPPQRKNVDKQKFGRYWYQGKAEINAFDLVQYRYGDAREGEAVLIFVTEEFSRKKHVKIDDHERAGRDKENVLKMNMTKEFITGIYPYNMMLSVFSPVYSETSAMKITASSQEWCGQSFTQMNLRGNSYKGRLYSYFEEEGDVDFSVKALAEDHLWNLIRIGPEHIPLGEVDLVPGLLEQRFSHAPISAEKALIRIKRVDSTYDELEVDYVHYNRLLKIQYEREFPYQIFSFEEIRILDDGTQEISHAQRKSVRQIDYWSKNRLGDSRLRRELRLDQ